MNPDAYDNALNTPDEFQFPRIPYDIQKNFMRNLYSALENSKLGIFESPTGTGKSLSIICGALRWLCDHDVRCKSILADNIARIEEELRRIESDTSDDWLSVQSKQSKIIRERNSLQVLLRKITDSEEEINSMKKRHEESTTTEVKSKDFRVLSARISHSEEEEENDLLDEVNNSDDELVEADEEDKYECTKIYFCSRTHSQLSQFIGEVQSSPYTDMRVVPLASRQTYCINPDVKRLKNLALINERCLELQKNKTSKTTKKGQSGEVIKKKKCTSCGCPFNNKTKIDELKEKIIIRIYDVEELVNEGQKISACPYYSARAAVPFSQLVVIPYNTLLHKSTRESSKIKLKGNIVIIDEAHNLLDAIGNMHSSSVTGNQLCLCHNQLTNYKNKYEKLFSAYNLLHLNQIIHVVGQLISMLGGKAGCNPIESSRKGIDTKMFTLTDFVHIAEIDNYNLYKLIDFCRKSKITHKLQTYSQKFPIVHTSAKSNENGLKAFLKNIQESKNSKVSKPESDVPSIRAQTAAEETSNNPILSVIAFIESLTNYCEDGRVVCIRQSTVGRGSLKFLLLNPAAHFQEIVKEARSVIVAGGTMQPIAEFREQLFENAGADPTRIVTFSCGHVIHPENILPIVLCSGPSGKQLDFSFQNRNTLVVMNELARILDNVTNIIPAGVVCFFPSYEYEQTVYQHLEKSGILEKLSAKKKVFREPKKTSDVDHVLEEYSRFIELGLKEADRKPNGSLLFSVIGGKLSEGLNFSDDLGRCVIVVGLPYPNIKSPELQEKMKYLDKTSGPGRGQQHYENLCMKAVNQSIGRAVRHRNDYASVLLLDHRYSRENVQEALPQWMKPSLITCEKFGPAFSSLLKFFKSRSTRSV